MLRRTFLASTALALGLGTAALGRSFHAAT